jgi:hypothetical protein
MALFFLIYFDGISSIIYTKPPFDDIHWSLDLSGTPDGVYVLRMEGVEAKMVVRQ